jgi:hypothetical protein
MLILLIPFDIEIEQIQASLLRESHIYQVAIFSIPALLDEIAESNASISGSMARLSGFMEQITEPLTCKSIDSGQKKSQQRRVDLLVLD